MKLRRRYYSRTIAPDDTWEACDDAASALVVSYTSTLGAGPPRLGDTCNPGFLEDVLASGEAFERLPDLLRCVERRWLLEDVLAPGEAFESLQG